MSLWDGIGAVLEKITDWIPGRGEAYKNELAKLIKENDAIQRKHPLSAIDASRYATNTERIKLLREKIANRGK